MTKEKMEAKKLLVSFLTVLGVLLLVATVSAADMTNNMTVKVDGQLVAKYDGSTTTLQTKPGVVAGDTILVKVWFKSTVDDTDVTLEAEINGEKVDSEAVSEVFDVENGTSYVKEVTVKVPFELKDQVSDDITLTVTLDGKDYRTTLDEIPMRVQRPSYDADVKSVTMNDRVTAGDNLPVDVVIKNMGYNKLDDLYVTVSIPALGLYKGPTYFGDLVPLEACTDNCDEEDTVSGRLYLQVPYDVKPGTYTVEVAVTNDDTTTKVVKQLVVENEFVNNVVVTGTSRTVAVGEDAEYSILIVNPTNQVKVYRLVTESSGDLTSSASEAIFAVPAGSSKTVKVTASADAEGSYNFNVNVFSGETLLETVPLSLKAQGAKTTTTMVNPIVILTVVLAVVFLVLLVVLIVLIGKKPQKSEDFGESYY